MGTKPGNKVPSIPHVGGRLLHRSMKGIEAIAVAGRDKTQYEKERGKKMKTKIERVAATDPKQELEAGGERV